MASVRMKVPSIRRFIRNHGEPLTLPMYGKATALIWRLLRRLVFMWVGALVFRMISSAFRAGRR
ncbi:MAG: hypothetical protein EBT47_03010 [Chloroflexi bacterium]|nr:hypothetical protein [Chloroflexota bacterium]